MFYTLCVCVCVCVYYAMGHSAWNKSYDDDDDDNDGVLTQRTAVDFIC